MTYISGLCADVGTVNCPCPLADTGDCLICSRLAGKDECSCEWAGVCIHNEYIQNGSVIRGARENTQVDILKKIWYGKEALVIVLKVSRGFALWAARPGSFVFVTPVGRSEISNVPISVMRADPEKGELFIAIRMISAKTKAIAGEEKSLLLRGVYRNGLLGRGLEGLREDCADRKSDRKKWLVITRGMGFAPAVNLTAAAAEHVDMDFIVDTDKVGDDIVMDYLQKNADSDKDCRCGAQISFRKASLEQAVKKMNLQRGGTGIWRERRNSVVPEGFNAEVYDRIILLTSDYYIKALSEYMRIPPHKLVYSNNFRMCCGEGICGACGHIDSRGNVSKMCKCRSVNIAELL